MIAFLYHAKNVQKFKSESLIACRNLISIKFRAKLLLVGPVCVDQWDCSPECDVLCGPMMVLPEIWLWIEKRRILKKHPPDMGAQLGVPYGHMGCRQFGVQFGYLDVYDLPFCVPYDVVLLLDVPVVLFCVPYDVVLLFDVPMDLCTQFFLQYNVQCTAHGCLCIWNIKLDP